MKRLLPDNLACQTLQEQRDTLAFAGPLSDDTGQQMLGTGLIVYRADSLEAARARRRGPDARWRRARLSDPAMADQRG